MMKRVLLNSQRKQLHDLLIKRGVDPAVTKWTNDGKGWASNNLETLQAGLCHFLFNPDSEGHLSIYFKPSLDGGASLGLVGQSWDNVLHLLEKWAFLVKNELAQEDPWQRYLAYLPPERLGGSTDNSPFSHQEAEHVAISVSILLEHVKRELPNYNEVARQFDPQFERIAEQAKKGAGRIDWSNQFVGMLISLCMSLSLAPDSASALWQYWVQIIDGLLLR
jgi:hypothetical protein